MQTCIAVSKISIFKQETLRNKSKLPLLRFSSQSHKHTRFMQSQVFWFWDEPLDTRNVNHFSCTWWCSVSVNHTKTLRLLLPTTNIINGHYKATLFSTYLLEVRYKDTRCNHCLKERSLSFWFDHSRTSASLNHRLPGSWEMVSKHSVAI